MTARTKAAGRWSVRVRWRQGRRWVYGTLTGHVEADGSLRVIEAGNGAARSIHAGLLQHQTSGPRGGKRWEPFGTAGPDPEPVVRRTRRRGDRAAGPVGQLALFGEARS